MEYQSLVSFMMWSPSSVHATRLTSRPKHWFRKKAHKVTTDALNQVWLASNLGASVTPSPAYRHGQLHAPMSVRVNDERLREQATLTGLGRLAAHFRISASAAGAADARQGVNA